MRRRLVVAEMNLNALLYSQEEVYPLDFYIIFVPEEED